MVSGHRMAAVDAQFYWMSATVPNDDFQLYAFNGEPADCGRAIEEVLRRAHACPGLASRIRDDSPLTYPRWVPAAVGDDQVVRHDIVDSSWLGCLAAVVAIACDQLDMRRMAWRLHVFTPVLGIPGVDGPGTVVVMQVPHALADGVRASAMAAWLLGRDSPVPQVQTPRPGFFGQRVVEAGRAHRRMSRDIRAGLLVAGTGPRPPLRTNAHPDGIRAIRTLVRHRSQLAGPTVTVAVLAAVSTALSRLLGAAAESLGAEVPMSKPGVAQARNHFGNVSVGLYPTLALNLRSERIAADLANGRRRFEHPATAAADRAFAAVPAPLLRWGVSRFDPDVRPPLVSGHTVVSSVNRGAADFSFGGCPVVLTAGYPPLSSVIGLTHGVHGVGDTVAISVHAATSAVPNVDEYVRLLDAAL
jgi:hypothetical protein